MKNIDAEKSIIGSALIAGVDLDVNLSHNDFSESMHRVAWKSICDMWDAGIKTDIVTVTSWLNKNGEIDQAGGPAYIASLTDVVPSVSSASHYANLVKESAIRRRAYESATIVLQRAKSGYDVDFLMSEAQDAFASIESGDVSHTHVSEIVGGVCDEILRRVDKKSEVTGISTGLLDLDRKLAGLQNNDLIILAARPSMGKTALSMGIAYKAALSGVPTLFFSLEMSKKQLVERLVSSEASVPFQNIRTGFLTDADMSRMSQAKTNISMSHLYIDETPSLTVREIRRRARACRSKEGLGLIVIDYLQFIQHAKMESMNASVGDTTRSLKNLAKELCVPVLCLSQLNRSLESRPDKKPVMSDLRESGNIEQDADVIMFIYRDEFYKKDSPDKGIAEILVRKQRNGPTGDVRAAFQGEYVRFKNLV